MDYRQGIPVAPPKNRSNYKRNSVKINGKALPTVPTHPFFSSYPQKNRNPFEQGTQQRGLGGVFSAIAVRPEAVVLQQPLTLSDEEQQIWQTQQTLPYWQPLNRLTASVQATTAPFMGPSWQRLLLPTGALAITLVAVVALSVGVVHTGQQLLAQYWQTPTSQPVYATVAKAVLAEETPQGNRRSTLHNNTVIEGIHPLEAGAIRQKATMGLGLGLLATAEAGKNHSLPTKDYRRTDPLKPSIELIKHFAPKPESLPDGTVTATPYSGGGRAVRPFPTASMGRLNAGYPTPSLPTGGATPTISIEEQSLPAMRFVGWVKSDTANRSVALIEVQKFTSTEGDNAVQTIAKPLNTPFTVEGQTVVLKKLTGSNRLEAVVGTQHQVLPLETSGSGTLKSAGAVQSHSSQQATTVATTKQSAGGGARATGGATARQQSAATASETLSNEELLQLLKQLNQP